MNVHQCTTNHNVERELFSTKPAGSQLLEPALPASLHVSTNAELLCFASFLECFVHIVLYFRGVIPRESFEITEVKPCGTISQPDHECCNQATPLATDEELFIGTPEGYKHILNRERSPLAGEASQAASIRSPWCSLPCVRNHVRQTVYSYLLFSEDCPARPTEDFQSHIRQSATKSLSGCDGRRCLPQCCLHTLYFYENYRHMAAFQRIRVRTSPTQFVSLEFLQPFRLPSVEFHTPVVNGLNVPPDSPHDVFRHSPWGAGTKVDPIILGTPGSVTERDTPIAAHCDASHPLSTQCDYVKTSMFIPVEKLSEITRAMDEEIPVQKRFGENGQGIMTPSDERNRKMSPKRTDSKLEVALSASSPHRTPTLFLPSLSTPQHTKVFTPVSENGRLDISCRKDEFDAFANEMNEGIVLPHAQSTDISCDQGKDLAQVRFDEKSPAYDIAIDIVADMKQCPRRIQAVHKESVVDEGIMGGAFDASDDCLECHSTESPSTSADSACDVNSTAFLAGARHHCNDTFAGHLPVKFLISRNGSRKGRVSHSANKPRHYNIPQLIQYGITQARSEPDGEEWRQSQNNLYFQPIWEDDGYLLSVVGDICDGKLC
ncbi:hypothetical protein XU18_1204 [Perkinsela sp. CCAP 1560/4]|nr:hypothetical protein XU18_1204 [Perkinsela sp. CCAP 1560/4]|eukprot:KNH08196.1 hypothetical protein XU18_1204 [Perkinsela sp. CCAP 1560/4]